MTLSRADLHIHTTYSDGLHEPEEAVNYAVTRTELRLIAITDHNTLDGAKHAHEYWQHHRAAFGQIEVIIGEEVSTLDGHVIGLFLHEPVPPHLSAEDTIRAIHEQGGIAVAAHPFTHLLQFTGLRGVGRKIAELPLDGVEVRNSVPTEVYANWIAEAYNARHRRHTPVGGSDCHWLPMIGRTYTQFDGSSSDDLKAAILSGAARPGGTVNGPLTVARFVRDQVHRHRLPLIRPDDHHYRYEVADLTVDVEELRQGGIAVLHCRGHIVRANAMILKADVFGLLEGGLTRLVFDLEEVVAVDGAGLGAIVSAQKRAQALGGDVALCAVRSHVAVTLKLQHLDKVLITRETASEAASALVQSGQPGAAQQAHGHAARTIRPGE
jgi:anti-anti-sigma factor